MSASNHNHVCFGCRTAYRRPKTALTKPRCLGCGAPCFNLGYKVEVPKHDDLRAWRALQAGCEAQAIAAVRERTKRSVRSQHDLEKEIARLRGLPENRDRTRHVQQLAEQLARLQRGSLEESDLRSRAGVRVRDAGEDEEALVSYR